MRGQAESISYLMVFGTFEANSVVRGYKSEDTVNIGEVLW